MTSPERFLIIDDDASNNTICEMVINTILPDTEVIAFENPQEGLDFIEENYLSNQDNKPTILFLDINMPSLNGWQFLKRYSQFSPIIKDKIFIYMLSSSIDERDMARAESNPDVKGFMKKPLSMKLVEGII